MHDSKFANEVGHQNAQPVGRHNSQSTGDKPAYEVNSPASDFSFMKGASGCIKEHLSSFGQSHSARKPVEQIYAELCF
jgi:hypothetical protein